MKKSSGINSYPSEPPPPYSAVPYNSPQGYPPQAAYENNQNYVPNYPSQIYKNPTNPYQNVTVITDSSFESGARFSNGRANIPPPPPGIPPNSAQIAMMNGATNIVVGQRKANFWTGDGTTEYTWW